MPELVAALIAATSIRADEASLSHLLIRKGYRLKRCRLANKIDPTSTRHATNG